MELEKAHVLLGQSQEAFIKNQLTRTTEDALEHGAFGAPTLIVHDETYVPHDAT